MRWNAGALVILLGVAALVSSGAGGETATLMQPHTFVKPHTVVYRVTVSYPTGESIRVEPDIAQVAHGDRIEWQTNDELGILVVAPAGWVDFGPGDSIGDHRHSAVGVINRIFTTPGEVCSCRVHVATQNPTTSNWAASPSVVIVKMQLTQ